MERARYSILKAEIEDQLKEVDKIYGRVQERASAKGRYALEGLAYQLHNLFCAYENLLDRRDHITTWSFS